MPTMTPTDHASVERAQALCEALQQAFLQWLEPGDEMTDQTQAILHGWSEAFAIALATTFRLGMRTYTDAQLVALCGRFTAEMSPSYFPDAVLRASDAFVAKKVH
jgi:hypothetical protein